MADFKKLKVWQKAHALALSVHRIAGKIRGAVHVSLKSQLIRAAMSIPANIVEGRGHRTDPEFKRYLEIAAASASELEAHVLMAQDMGVIPQREVPPLLDQIIEVRKMLNGLIATLG